MGTKTNTDNLNKLLRGEISAVETYKMALDKLDKTSTARSELMTCMASHQDRVALLRQAVAAAGGEPATGSGPWGVFAKAVEGSAKIFGDKAAVAALEEGEDHGLKDYEGITEQDPMVIRLLPMQRQTHDRLAALKKTLSAKA